MGFSMKQIVVLLLIGFCLGSFVLAQDSSKVDSANSKVIKQSKLQQDDSASKSDWTKTPLFVLAVISSIIGVSGFLFGVYQYVKRNKITEEKSYHGKVGEKKYEIQESNVQSTSAEQIYKNALTEELGTIRLLGSPEIENLPVNLLDSFVSLSISES